MCVFVLHKKQAYHETHNKITVYKNERVKETVDNENEEQKDGRRMAKKYQTKDKKLNRKSEWQRGREKIKTEKRG